MRGSTKRASVLPAQHQGPSWTAHEALAGQTLELQSIHGQLKVDDVYREALEGS